MTSAQSDLQQLEQIEQLGRGPNGPYTLTVPPRQRGLVSQVTMVLVRPGEFFDALAIVRTSRQWVWIAAVVLALVGLSAVRYQSASQQVADGDPAGGADVSGGVPIDPFGGSGGVAVEGSFDTGLSDTGAPSAGGAVSDKDVTDEWTTALIAGSNVLLAWGILAVLLGVVSLMNGRAPRFGHNVQVAVWASVPLGLMAGLQMIFFLMGGSAGAAGLSGLLADWSGYASLSEPVQKLAVSAAERLTLFAVWTVALAYIGARHALRGRWWVVVPVVVAWAAIIIVLPVLAGTVDLPQSDEVAQGDDLQMVDPAMMDGGMPGEADSMIEPGMEGALPDGMGGINGLDDTNGLPLDGTAEAAPGEVGPFATEDALSGEPGGAESGADSALDPTSEPASEPVMIPRDGGSASSGGSGVIVQPAPVVKPR
ncbi:YIP1 family protein [Aggregatilinea lenta]|uniref:YIP1 family protein n=1 Tax=Aggregatilinea lenta TaxID=913108 RepID=UPI0013C2E7AD|nr:YIP1 family protein [Aggregatilinea lenta]